MTLVSAMVIETPVGIGMGVGAEEQVAKFVSYYIAKHFSVSEFGMVGAGGEILIIDVRINSTA